jgi:hypothetical protein
MVPSDCLFDTMTTVDMSASGNIAVDDRIETYRTLEFVLKFLGAYSEAVFVKVVDFYLHLILCQLYYSLLVCS